MPSGSKYVGCSNNLARRIASYYYKSTSSRVQGKFVPLLISRPLSEFTLEVFFTQSIKGCNSYLILEQYFLLMAQFNLNTIRVSGNPSGHQAKSLYLYNSNGTICYFRSDKQIDFINGLGIHFVTFTKHVKGGTLFLDKYLLSNTELQGSTMTDMTVEEVRAMRTILIELITIKISH